MVQEVAAKKVASIVTGKLRSTGATKVTERYSGEVGKQLEQFRRDIEAYQKALKEGSDRTVTTTVLEGAKKRLKELEEKANKIVTTVREYVDSKGAKYVETVEKNGSSYGTGTPVRKLEKIEEEFLRDGRKIETRTIHDKSDHRLLGEGHQDGLITKIETFKTKDGVAVGRRTTTQQASGYGGKTVKKEISVDGAELGANNTKTTYSNMDSNGIKCRKETYEPGTNWQDGYEQTCNERGIPQVVTENIKPGW